MAARARTRIMLCRCQGIVQVNVHFYMQNCNDPTLLGVSLMHVVSAHMQDACTAILLELYIPDDPAQAVKRTVHERACSASLFS
jgi:hypothetical protein